MNLKSRLGKLEARKQGKRRYGQGTSERGWERYFHIHENARREIGGLEPLPDLEYTEEDYDDDIKFLKEVIPYYRDSWGWQTREAIALLDEWEREAREKISEYERDGR